MDSQISVPHSPSRRSPAAIPMFKLRRVTVDCDVVECAFNTYRVAKENAHTWFVKSTAGGATKYRPIYITEKMHISNYRHTKSKPIMKTNGETGTAKERGRARRVWPISHWAPAAVTLCVTAHYDCAARYQQFQHDLAERKWSRLCSQADKQAYDVEHVRPAVHQPRSVDERSAISPNRSRILVITP